MRTVSNFLTSCLVATVLCGGSGTAFAPSSSSSSSSAGMRTITYSAGKPSSSSSSTSTSTSSLFGQMEQIEFKIYPDGRVEETVRGVKGSGCHAITEEINKALGKVVSTEPTPELYEQELVIDQTLTEKLGITTGNSWEGSGGSSSSW